MTWFSVNMLLESSSRKLKVKCTTRESPQTRSWRGRKQGMPALLKFKTLKKCSITRTWKTIRLVDMALKPIRLRRIRPSLKAEQRSISRSCQRTLLKDGCRTLSSKRPKRCFASMEVPTMTLDQAWSHHHAACLRIHWLKLKVGTRMAAHQSWNRANKIYLNPLRSKKRTWSASCRARRVLLMRRRVLWNSWRFMIRRRILVCLMWTKTVKREVLQPLSTQDWFRMIQVSLARKI